MPKLSDINRITYVDGGGVSHNIKTIYSGNVRIWHRDTYPIIPWVSATKVCVYPNYGATINFKCNSRISVSVSGYLSDKLTIVPQYPIGTNEGYFDIYPSSFPSSGSYIGYIYVTNSVTGDTTIIKICIGANETSSRNVRVITGGTLQTTWGSTFSFAGYTFDSANHLCILLTHWTGSETQYMLIPAGQTDWSARLCCYGASDNIETATPTIEVTSNTFTYTDIHYAIGGSWGTRLFYGCTNVGFGGVGYAFGGTAQGGFSACAFSNDLTSGCEDYGYTTNKPLASQGEYFAFTDSCDISGLSLQYIDD